MNNLKFAHEFAKKNYQSFSNYKEAFHKGLSLYSEYNRYFLVTYFCKKYNKETKRVSKGMPKQKVDVSIYFDVFRDNWRNFINDNLIEIKLITYKEVLKLKKEFQGC